MSIWYQYDVTAFASNAQDIAKFFHLYNSRDDVRVDQFEFSFGQKNGPGLRLGAIIEHNPGLIFLVKQSTDFDTTWWLDRFDEETSTTQSLFIYQFHLEMGEEFNKRIFAEYEKEYHYLMDQHREGRPYEWKWFFNYEKADNFLKHREQYQDRIMMSSMDDLELDLAGNDYLDEQ